jgi:hypothetical protein
MDIPTDCPQRERRGCVAFVSSVFVSSFVNVKEGCGCRSWCALLRTVALQGASVWPRVCG